MYNWDLIYTLTTITHCLFTVTKDCPFVLKPVAVSPCVLIIKPLSCNHQMFFNIFAILITTAWTDLRLTFILLNFSTGCLNLMLLVHCFAWMLTNSSDQGYVDCYVDLDWQYCCWQLKGSSPTRLLGILINSCWKNAAFCVVLLHVAIFRNVTPTINEDPF